MNRKIFEDIKIKKEKVFVKPKIPFFVEEKINNDKKEEIEKELNFKKILKESNLKQNKKKIKWDKIIIVSSLLLFLGGIIFWGSSFFEQISINITKKHQIFNLEKKVFDASKKTESPLSFEIMIFSEETSENLSLTKSSEVSLKAKGQLTLYNEYSKDTIKLISNTYISDENGKVYLTDKAISIPGYTLKDDKIIPGEISVSATSFLPGKNYNGSPVDFTINSYKGTPKFKKIYGKAITTFSGGASGLNYSLEEKDLENLKNIANSKIKESLIGKVDSLIPKEYIFYPGAYAFSYKIDENILSETAEAKIDVTGTLSVVLLKENNLKDLMIKKLIPDISDSEIKKIEINGIEKLIFNFVDGEQLVNKELDSFSFNLTGEVDFIWNPNIEELKNNLLNAQKETLSEIFKKDVGIEKADIKIFPPWSKNLPNDINKIKISIF